MGSPCTRERAQVRLNRLERGQDARFLIDWRLTGLPLIQEQSETDPLHVFRTWLARMLILAPILTLIDGISEGDTLLPNRDCSNLGGVVDGSPPWDEDDSVAVVLDEERFAGAPLAQPQQEFAQRLTG